MKRPATAGLAWRALPVAALLAATTLAGCTTVEKEDPSIAAAAALPVTCYTREDCAEKWIRARAWLAAHTARPITADRTSLKTAQPTARDPSAGFEIIISQESPSHATITFNATCRGACKPDPDDLRGDFNLYLSASNPPPLAPLAPAKNP